MTLKYILLISAIAFVAGITVLHVFVNEGDRIRVDTRTGEYLGRA